MAPYLHISNLLGWVSCMVASTFFELDDGFGQLRLWANILGKKHVHINRSHVL